MMGSIIHDFKKIVMIGDHRQLPAVVQQSPSTTRVQQENLKEWGLVDLGNSLFERLFINAQNKSWTQAFDRLSFQGRMHPNIMKFPAHSFYDGELQMLNHLPKLLDSLKMELPSDEEIAPMLSFLSKNRLLYRSSEIREEELLGKTNSDEAKKVVEMIGYYQKLWHYLGREWSENTLGVITPFRAQIAQIKKELWASNIHQPKTINVDTVERYQGSARDIIIMSLCVNRPDQWSAICSLNTEGVDRKLNVAMTRARMVFVLIGNSEQMGQQALYSKLLESCVPFPSIC
jgi:DNA replication ATP-dependent helicase Dna2